MKKNIFIALGIFIFVVANLVYWWQLGGAQYNLLKNLIYLIPVILALLAGIFVVRSYGVKSRHGNAFLLITLGFTFWLIGESLWVFYSLFLQIDPYPSPADFFYLAAYPLIAWGLIKEIRITGINLKKLSKPTLAFFGFASLIAIGMVTYIEIFLAFNPSGSLVDNLVLLYGFADLIIAIPILLVLILAFEYKGGKIFIPWILIFIGLNLYLFADILYAVFLNQYLGAVYPYESIDLLWIAAYLLMALGLMQIGLIIRDIQKRLKSK